MFLHYFCFLTCCLLSKPKACYLCCSLPFVKQEAQQYKILYIGLYLLIWGEAANLRFMPECLCYIFHHVGWNSTNFYFPFLKKNVRRYLFVFMWYYKCHLELLNISWSKSMWRNLVHKRILNPWFTEDIVVLFDPCNLVV